MRYNESINDKNLFKAVFIAGAILVNTDVLFEMGLNKAGLPLIVDMSD